MCARRQKKILTDVWPCVKPGGILVYATCSFSSAENEEMLDFAADAFDCDSVSVSVPQGWGIVEVASPEHSFRGYRFYPHLVRGEGLFMAVVRRKQAAGPVRQRTSLKRLKSSDLPQSAANYLADKGFFYFSKAGDTFAIQAEHHQDFSTLSPQLYFRKLGLHLGQQAKDWIPSHDLAMSLDRSQQIPSVDLELSAALKYLKREDVELEAVPRGWQLVTYQRQPLGWLKSLGNRINNYLPPGLRIRMQVPPTD
jgi:NOL1/NOP2/fmu family ribosome biogenesis protein